MSQSQHLTSRSRLASASLPNQLVRVSPSLTYSSSVASRVVVLVILKDQRQPPLLPCPASAARGAAAR